MTQSGHRIPHLETLNGILPGIQYSVFNLRLGVVRRVGWGAVMRRCLRSRSIVTVFFILAALATVAMLAPFNASAQQSGNVEICESTNPPNARISACTAIIETQGQTVDQLAFAYGNRGTAYREIGDMQSAIKDYDESIRLSPKNPASFMVRGNFDRANRDFDRAIADYTQALELEPNFYKAYIGRGNVYGDKAEYDGAIADYSEAIRLNPADALTYGNRGAAYAAKGQCDLAIRDYDQAIRLNPQFATAFYGRGYCYSIKGDYDRAIVEYDQELKLNPNDANAIKGRAYAVAKRGH